MIQGEDHPCNSHMFLPSSAQEVGVEGDADFYPGGAWLESWPEHQPS
jgi:hypothetical protein